MVADKATNMTRRKVWFLVMTDTNTTNSLFDSVAPMWLAAGFSPFPLPVGKKFPPPAGFTGKKGRWITQQLLDNPLDADGDGNYTGFHSLDPDVVDARNLGIRMPYNVVSIDIDNSDGKVGLATIASLENELDSQLPDTYQSTARWGTGSGNHLFRIPDSMVLGDDGNTREYHDVGLHVELVHWGHRYLMTYPSIHPSAGPVKLYDPDGNQIFTPPSVDDLPELPVPWVEYLTKKPRVKSKSSLMTDTINRQTGQADNELEVPTNDMPRNITPYAQGIINNTKAVFLALQTGQEDNWDQNTFNQACRLVRLANSDWSGVDLDMAYDIFIENAPRDGTGWDDRIYKKWESAISSVGDEPILLTDDAKESVKRQLVAQALADEVIHNNSQTALTTTTPPPNNNDDDNNNNNLTNITPTGPDSTALSDVQVALTLVPKLKDKLFAHTKTGWGIWDGRRWNVNVNDDHARAVVVEELRRFKAHQLATCKLDEVEKRKYQIALEKLESASRIRAVMTILRAYCQKDITKMNGIAHLLNVANGVLDLRNGTLMPHDPSYNFTKLAPTKYIPEATSPYFDSMLDLLPKETIDWLQVKYGQGLTGNPSPDSRLVIFSDGVVTELDGDTDGATGMHPLPDSAGSTGKSSFLMTMLRPLGEGEFMNQVSEEIIRNDSKEHATKFMDLLGLRQAYIEELDTPLNGNNIKKISSIDQPIKARKMQQDFVTFLPTHMMTVTSNGEDLRITATDLGTWRRIALVRFTKRLPLNSAFATALKTDEVMEASLAWQVRGAMKYYQDPATLDSVPEEVDNATEAWRGESNSVAKFIDEMLEFDGGGELDWSGKPKPPGAIAISEILELARFWAKREGVMMPGSQKFWKRALRSQLFREHPLDIQRKIVRRASYTVHTGNTGSTAGLPNTFRALTNVKFSDIGNYWAKQAPVIHTS